MKHLALLATILILFSTSLRAVSAFELLKTSDTKPLNIVYILSDDHRYDVMSFTICRPIRTSCTTSSSIRSRSNVSAQCVPICITFWSKQTQIVSLSVTSVRWVPIFVCEAAPQRQPTHPSCYGTRIVTSRRASIPFKLAITPGGAIEHCVGLFIIRESLCLGIPPKLLHSLESNIA